MKYSFPLLLVFATACSQAPQTPASGADLGHGETLFKQRCALCHSVGTRGGQGPGMANVVGRTAATGPYFQYTKALRESGLTWDAATLDKFLEAPSTVVPGTLMMVATKDANERKSIIEYLATLQSSEAVPTRPVVAPAATSQLGAVGDDTPGKRYRITADSLPQPFASESASNRPRLAERGTAMPVVGKGFRIELVTAALKEPRLIRVAPNGDVFAAESDQNRISVVRNVDGGKAEVSVFADNLDGPFGMAFYPLGESPAWLYVANNNAVVRFPYKAGDLKASGKLEVIVKELSKTTGGHTTRDIVFAPDGKHFYVSVGSGSNVADGIGKRDLAAAAAWDKQYGLGAPWGSEDHRATVQVFDSDGKNGRIFATGIRNCVGLAVQPATGDVWCSTNERDGLGDDLVPDYVTRVREGAFYGWPWYYIGNHEDPRRKGERPDLADKVTVPDVLLQSHSASLGMTFYDGKAFPPEYRGSAFSALHGSWNRARRTGYKVVRILVDANGAPTGEYEDFVTGFAPSEDRVWGRPVGVAVSKSGALLVSDDGSSTLWRVTPETDGRSAPH